MKLHRDQRGLKGVELGMGLLMVGLLAALAIPLMSRVTERVEDVAAGVEGRTASLVAAADGLATDDAVQVAGVQLVRSADGATCRWTVSSSGTVFGVWELGGTSLYGTFEVQPDPCPTAADAESVGFGSTFAGP
jgi:Tfp pilus assembly protein FimT